MESHLPTGDPARGEALFSDAKPASHGPLGCIACHSVDGSTGVGPTAVGIAGRLPAGYDSAEYYLREAILLPEAYKVPGFESIAMPPNFGNRLTAQDLADIIAYLLTLE
jgi:cytochrome c oxidase subunit 2